MKKNKRGGSGQRHRLTSTEMSVKVSTASNSLESSYEMTSNFREVVLEQLKIINQLSEVVILKDKQIKVLKEDRDQLLKRLSRIELVTEPVLPVEEADDSASIQSSNEEIPRKRKRGRPATKDKGVGTLPIQPSVNKGIQAKEVSQDENGVELEDTFEECLMTDQPYFTFQGEDFIEEEKAHVAEIMSQAEVPGWRVMAFSPTYTMEGTENIEDETFLGRHTKLELDEKKRKKWDIQRMREQRQIEKLKQRYEDSLGLSGVVNGTSSTNGPGVLTCLSNLQNFRPEKSLLPQPEQATHILISEELPVTAFGYPVPILPREGFSLPWHK